jgi:hypothetical protein
MGGPVLDHKALAICIDVADDPPGAAGDLGNYIGSEPLNDLIERALDRLHRCQLLDEPIAPFEGIAALDGIAITVIGRP